MQESKFHIALIKQSIELRQPILACYANLYRKVCPHVLGWKHGIAHALCWQYGGDSKKGGLPEWRCIPVDELTEIQLLNEPWQSSPNYSVALQSCVDEVILSIE